MRSFMLCVFLFSVPVFAEQNTWSVMHVSDDFTGNQACYIITDLEVEALITGTPRRLAISPKGRFLTRKGEYIYSNYHVFAYLTSVSNLQGVIDKDPLNFNDDIGDVIQRMKAGNELKIRFEIDIEPGFSVSETRTLSLIGFTKAFNESVTKCG